MTRMVAIDFFCGAGGMTNGLIQAGFHVLAGVDNEPLCEKTYRQNKNRNGGKPEYLCMDIFPRTRSYPQGQQREIAQRIAELQAEYKRKTRLGSVDLVFAICAPCQPFTKITKIEMSDGRQFKRDNDSNLLLTTLRLVKLFRPSAVICENVEGIGDGDDSVLQRFKRRLGRLGYSFDAKVVNAANFGIPQNRKRTIGIGFDRGRHGKDFEVPLKNARLKAPVTVRDAIGHLPPLAAGEVHSSIPNHRARSLSELNLKRISSALPGKSNAYLRDTPYGDPSLECHRRLKERTGQASFGDTYTRMDGDAVGPTITTKCMAISNGRFGHFDVSQNRAITPREAASLQTFSQRYMFYPEYNVEFTCRLIGNAVPPRLAKYVGRFIRRQLGTL